MTQFEALVSLNMVHGIGGIRLQRLLDYFETPEKIIHAPVERLKQVYGIGDDIARAIASFKGRALEKELRLAEKQGVNILTCFDSGYPAGLAHIPSPPIVLYVRGQILEQDAQALAIVGSRKASYYGLTQAEKFAAELSEQGFTIVSGMARGIDTYAHKGALKRGGRTLAVIGSGFSRLYPAENKELAQEISRNGAVISEFSMETEPQRFNFPRRNRIISGLSRGVIVVEAAQNSGALITADFALEQGREVFALPGKVDSGTSFGTNELIKQGAMLVVSSRDIVEAFETYTGSQSVSFKTERKAALGIDSVVLERARASAQAVDSATSRDENEEAHSEIANGNHESQVYGLLSREPISIDEILEKVSLDVSSVSEILLRLQLKKLVRQLQGKQYVLWERSTQ